MAEFNPHIFLVMRWLLNSDSVSEKELDNNYSAAYRAYTDCTDNANYAATRTAVSVASNAAKADAAVYAAARYAARAAAATAANAAYAGYYGVGDAAVTWLNKTKESLDSYFDLSGEDRKKYEQRVKYLSILGASNEQV